MSWLVGLVACVASAAAIPAVIHLAHRVGAIDAPHSDVRTHRTPTPLLGGLAIATGTQAGVVAGREILAVSTVTACLVLLALGAYKDVTRKDVSPIWQLAVQGIACAMLVSGYAPLPYEAFILVTGGTALINAMNFLDVTDGLCGSVAAAIAIGFFLLEPSPVSLALAGALIGFLAWNRPPARIFMGDTGSFFIGGVLFHLTLSTIDTPAALPAVGLLLAVPIAELVFTTMVRAASGRSIFRGNAAHPSLLLLNAGMSPWVVLVTFALLAAVSTTAAVLYGF